MRKEEFINHFKEVLFNKGLMSGNRAYSFDEELEVFYDADKEIEWQIRDYSNGDLKSVLVRYCDDTTHTYVELYEYDFADPYDLIFYSLDEALDDLDRKYMKKVAAKYE